MNKKSAFSGLIVVLIVALLLILGIIFWLPRITNNSGNSEQQTNSPANAYVESESNSPIYQKSYPSIDGTFSLNISYYDSDNACRFNVTDNKGDRYDVSKLFGTDIITGCDFEQGDDFWHYFGGWGDGGQLLLPGNPGEVHIVDIKALSLRTYLYDANGDLQFNGVDRSLNYWLFRKGDSYVLFDRDHNIVLANLIYFNALYDIVNNGFVFLALDQTGSSTMRLKVDFLSIGDLKIRNILVTDPFVPVPHDSEPPRLLSRKVGEIIYDPGIPGVPEKYFESDFAIHINL